MGTRGQFTIRYGGVDKGMYNHYDSYPSGKGIDFAKAVKKFADSFSTTEEREMSSGYKYTAIDYNEDACKKKLIEIYNRIRMVDEDSTPTDEDMAKYLPKRGKEGADLVKYGHQDREWYSLLHDLQGNMDAYLNGDADIMIDGSDFMVKDSLFCEWAYTLNIDTMKIEVWRGFQEKPQKGNRYGEKPTYTSEGYTMKDLKGKETKHPDTHYYPCKLLATFNIFRLEPEYAMGICDGIDWAERYAEEADNEFYEGR